MENNAQNKTMISPEEQTAWTKEQPAAAAAAPSLYRYSPPSSVHENEKEEDEGIFFEQGSEASWERADDSKYTEEFISDYLFEDVFVDGDDVSSLYSPMERGEAGASLPTVEEVRSSIHIDAQKMGDIEEEKASNSRRTPLVVVAVGVFLLMITIGLIVGFAIQTRDAGNGDDDYEDPVDDDATRRSNYAEVKDFVVGYGVSSLKDFEDSASPQARAASWLANMDQANLAVPVYNAEKAADDYYDYMARYAMTVLYFATNGENWHQQFNFLTQGDICTWKGHMIDASGTKSVPYGVDCDEDGTIWGLYLDRLGLDGFIPKEIGILTTLNILDFTFNEKLVGRFPKGVCNLVSLDSLYLGHTHIRGELPACIGNLKKLRSLFLSDTLMAGPLPPTLSILSFMEVLMMEKNGFSGDITNMFQNMPLLQFLFLGDNQLSATVDDTFLTSNPNMTQIDISDNDMVGVLPWHFFDGQSMPNLQMLDLHGNHLEGMLPENVPKNDALLFVDLHENSISGSIPISWTQNLPNLYHLDLSSNKLKGPMRPEIGEMTNLIHLFLGNNPFDVGPIPTSFANLTKMQEFSVKSTSRQGNIPDFIGSTWSELRLLDLNENAIQGVIPDSLGNLEQLEFLFLNRNQLIGQVPRSLMNLVNVRAVFLESNQLTGDLDSTLCLMPSFSFSYLRDSDALLVADCIGAYDVQEQSRHQEPLTCRCCTICCMVGDVDCHDRNDDVASLDPNWQQEYNSVKSDFGNATRFVNRNYIHIETRSKTGDNIFD